MGPVALGDPRAVFRSSAVRRAHHRDPLAVPALAEAVVSIKLFAATAFAGGIAAAAIVLGWFVNVVFSPLLLIEYFWGERGWFARWRRLR